MNSLAITNNPVLQNIMLGYKPAGLIRDLIFPKISVSTEKGDILTGGKDHLRIVNNLAGQEGTTPSFDYSVTKAEVYSIEEHRLKNLVTKKDKEKWGGFDKAERIAGKMVHYANLIQAEYGIASQLTSASTMTNNTTLNSSQTFSNYEDSDPITTINTAITSVFDACGVVPNVAIMGRPVHVALRYHPSLLDKMGYKYNRPGGLTDDEIAKLFNLEKILVGTSKYNSAKKGQTAVLTNIWDDDMILAVVNTQPNPEEFEPTLGITFTGNNPVLADTYMVDDPPEARWVREEMDYDDVIVDVNAGYLILNAA